MKDKIGYTLGDLGCCCTEQFRAMYLAIFYTLVLKVNPVHVGILMLVTKLWDAINDPLIGALVDSHKNTGKGKFIPWIKFFAFPTAVLCVLGFVNVSNFAYVPVLHICSSLMLYMKLCTLASTFHSEVFLVL